MRELAERLRQESERKREESAKFWAERKRVSGKLDREREETRRQHDQNFRDLEDILERSRAKRCWLES